jgi:hypothetical protein
MTFSVNQPWDPLRVCVVGKSYGPAFYEFIKNKRLRTLFERIAAETEEDYQRIVDTLTSLGVKVVRPNVPGCPDEVSMPENKRIPGPISMNPRDQMIMIGSTMYFFPYRNIGYKTGGWHRDHDGPKESNWNLTTYKNLQGPDWPRDFVPYELLPNWIKQELKTLHRFEYNPGEFFNELLKSAEDFPWWDPVIDCINQQGNRICDDEILSGVSANGVTRIGLDLYFGRYKKDSDRDIVGTLAADYFPEYRCHKVITDGHIDGCFSPVVPGLILSIEEISNYKDTFPDWEVIYLPQESWYKMQSFLDLKKKNRGKWWIKDHEHDQELIDFVETWLGDWTGYAEETVFDVNILTVDEKNVIVSGYNKTVFDAFDRYGITAHICPLRHRYFWDGGIHCVTLDLDRTGERKDFFPERNNFS